MADSRLGGRAESNGFAKTCLKGIGVIVDYLWYKKKVMQSDGK
jgi:hypothetical protein